MAQDVFIQSKKSFHFKDGQNDATIPAQFVGKLPEWATKTILFDLAVKGGDITYVGEPPKATPDSKEPDKVQNPDSKADAKGAAK